MARSLLITRGVAGSPKVGTTTKAPLATPSSSSAGSTVRDGAPGEGGELHQTASDAESTLTTNQGIPISDDQNSLRVGPRGATLLEDFVLREKITHFDHERIPERVVHARGSGAHGYFQVYESLAPLTRAAFLQNPGEKTRVFVRFSTVAGGAGSTDLPRDVRGFAVRFYTQEGNFDLVGNNIPVFFIQDAIKFPDLVHSVKMEPDRGFPQAASAHDTFWDFASLMPESMHMLMWVMSDRALPRSRRTMQGFGVHPFRLVNADGTTCFVKFHWRPTIGSQSVLWDEAVKISGADPDFHRRDHWEAIEKKHFPEFELGLQVFDEQFANSFDFDVLDATKLIPEELVPVRMIGKLTLDRNSDNFFAETEQIAYHPGNLVPGIEVSEDPLLQGRVFSYLDTQLLRLGGPNFHEIPINRPVCPLRNFQRDGHMRIGVDSGRVNYEPNSLGPRTPRETPDRGFRSAPVQQAGPKLRQRSETFADHYSQARLFFRSQSDPERRHLIKAFAFELGKVETLAVRTRMLGHLHVIDEALGAAVERALRMQGKADTITPARTPLDLPASPALSLLAKPPGTLRGRKLAVLVGDGADAKLLAALRAAADREGAELAVIAPWVTGVKASDDSLVAADHALVAAPSVFFDAIALLLTSNAAHQLALEASAVDFVRDAFGHLKAIGVDAGGRELLKSAGVRPDAGIVEARDTRAFITVAKTRQWKREPSLRRLP
jgi:catalase